MNISVLPLRSICAYLQGKVELEAQSCSSGPHAGLSTDPKYSG